MTRDHFIVQITLLDFLVWKGNLQFEKYIYNQAKIESSLDWTSDFFI